MPDWTVDISPMSMVAGVFAGIALLVSVFTLARGVLEWATGRTTNSPELAVTGRKRALQGIAGAFVAAAIGAWLTGLLAFGSASSTFTPDPQRLTHSPGTSGGDLLLDSYAAQSGHH